MSFLSSKINDNAAVKLFDWMTQNRWPQIVTEKSFTDQKTILLTDSSLKFPNEKISVFCWKFVCMVNDITGGQKPAELCNLWDNS